MGSVVVWPPLGAPMQYDPSFKVEVCLNEPLWSGTVTQNDVAIEVSSLCAQLDLLCQKELSLTSTGRIDHGKVSRSFETKSMILLEKLKSALQTLPGCPHVPEDYLDYTGLAKLYPRAAAYVTRPTELSLASKRTTMDGYFGQLSTLHQLVTMAHQINSDVTNLNNHKYIAHQVALLYQSLNALGDQPLFVGIRDNIQEHFSTLKEALTPEEGKKQVFLSHEHATWLLEVTSSVVNTVTQFPKQLIPDMFPAAHTLSALLSQ